MESICRDVAYSLRGFRRSPGFSAAAVTILAIGIAANTAIFSVINAVLLRPLPIKEPARVVVIHDQLPKLNLPRTEVSGAQYVDYSGQTEIFESTAAFAPRNFNLTGLGDPQRLQAERITGGFFPLLGVAPALGRTFTPADDRYQVQHVTMLSVHAWRQLFNSDPGAVGKTLILDGTGYDIIGVAPATIEDLYPSADIWIPMAFSPAELSEQLRFSLAYGMLARLKSGVTLKQAQSVMTAFAKQSRGGDSGDFNIEVRSIVDEKLGDVSRPLYLLLAAVLIVLLISCANIASLLLARASGRGREIAIRVAVGAGRSRLIRQMLTESLMLALFGGGVGVLLAAWGVRALIAIAPTDLPRAASVGLDGRVLWFTVLVSLGSGILFGLFPALTASRTNLIESLKESGKGETTVAARQSLRAGLVIAEVALAFALLFSAGLLLRSFARLLDVKPGFDPDNILTMRISLTHNQQPDYIHAATFYRSLLPLVQGLPGVKYAAAATEPPFTPGADNSVFAIKDYQAGPGKPDPHADYLTVTTDYLRTLGVPVIQGRDFVASDMVNDGPMSGGSSVLIDESLARRFWPNGDALGASVGWGQKGPWAKVVGVVGTVRPDDLAEESKGTIYFPFSSSIATLVIRTAGDPHGLIQAVREQVLAVDHNQPVYDIRTMDERVASSLERRRFGVTLLAIFAALALVLAAIGLYGVIAYLVTQRTGEIGIRMALGAARHDILTLVIRRALLLALAGLILGLCGSFAALRYFESLLYEVPPADPLTVAMASILLAMVATVATLIPARRAMKVDPMTALRYQ